MRKSSRASMRLAERQRDYAESVLAKTKGAAAASARAHRRGRGGLVRHGVGGAACACRAQYRERRFRRPGGWSSARVASRLSSTRQGGLNKVGGTQQAGALQRWFPTGGATERCGIGRHRSQRQASIVLWLDMIEVATPAQRQHLRERLLGWADDLDRAARAVLLAEAKG